MQQNDLKAVHYDVIMFIVELNLSDLGGHSTLYEAHLGAKPVCFFTFVISCLILHESILIFNIFWNICPIDGYAINLWWLAIPF